MSSPARQSFFSGETGDDGLDEAEEDGAEQHEPRNEGPGRSSAWRAVEYLA
jgi:hypothetical protein